MLSSSPFTKKSLIRQFLVSCSEKKKLLVLFHWESQICLPFRMERWLTWRRVCSLTVSTAQKRCYISLDPSQDLNYLATDNKVVLAPSNPLDLDFFKVTSSIQESGVKYLRQQEFTVKLPIFSLHWFGGRIWPIAGEDCCNTATHHLLLSYFQIALLLGDLQWSIKTPCKRSVRLDTLEKNDLSRSKKSSSWKKPIFSNWKELGITAVVPITVEKS